MFRTFWIVLHRKGLVERRGLSLLYGTADLSVSSGRCGLLKTENVQKDVCGNVRAGKQVIRAALMFSPEKCAILRADRSGRKRPAWVDPDPAKACGCSGR